MINMIKEKYKDYLYINIMLEERKNAAFYEKFDFKIMKNGTPMQICNFKN